MKPVPFRLRLKEVKAVFTGEVCQVSSGHTGMEHLLDALIGDGGRGQNKTGCPQE